MWHEEAITNVVEILYNDSDVKGLLLIGSCSRSDVKADLWSDIDIAIVVDDSALTRFYPAIDWVKDFGTPYALDQNKTDDYYVLRVWFRDSRHFDFVIVTERSLKQIKDWEYNPLRYGGKLLFSRSPALDDALSMAFPSLIRRSFSDEQFSKLANNFWFKGMLAVTKAARNELLVAVHLSLDMIRDCLLLGMALRDRATGTNHHKDGSNGNHIVAELEKTMQPYTIEGVLASIEQSAITFDSLALRWDDAYISQRAPLLDFITMVRHNLSQSACTDPRIVREQSAGSTSKVQAEGLQELCR